MNFGKGKTQFRFDLATKVQVGISPAGRGPCSLLLNRFLNRVLSLFLFQMYYKNIFEDIAMSDYGPVSSLFERKPDTMLRLVQDYLYSQGYFNTLACLEGKPSHKLSMLGKLGLYKDADHHLASNQMDERENLSKNSLAHAPNLEPQATGSALTEGGARPRNEQPIDSKVLLEKDFQPGAAAIDQLKLSTPAGAATLSRDLLQQRLLSSDQQSACERRQDRFGSFLTDKDPSFIQPPEEPTYSDVGGEAV